MSKAVGAVGALGFAAGALALLAAPAGAHISPDKDEVPAGGFSEVTLTVPHGCEDAPTRELSIEIPEGIVDAAPQVHPGWKVAVVEEELAEPIDDEGEQITERVASITFTATAGNELPNHFRDKFTVGFKTPDTPGEYLFFKLVQRCTVGETAWIEEYTGEGEEPEHPAPALLITESEGGPHGNAAGEDEDEEEAEGDDADADDVDVSATSDDDSDSSSGLAVAALVVGLVGVAGAGFAISRTRKPTAGSD